MFNVSRLRRDTAFLLFALLAIALLIACLMHAMHVQLRLETLSVQISTIIERKSTYKSRKHQYPKGVERKNLVTCRCIFVDLGGYTGDTLAMYGGPRFMSKNQSVSGQETYVFEIDPDKVAKILEKLQGPLAHLKPITQVLNVAAWNKDEILRVTLTGHNDGRVKEDGQALMMAYDIGAWFLRAIVPHSCDDILLKMDIEGAEVEALQSLHVAGVLPLVDHLNVEWHDRIMPAVASVKANLISMIQINGLEYGYATLTTFSTSITCQANPGL